MCGGHDSDGALGVVWGDADLIGFGESTDLLHFGDSADVDDVGLGDVDRAGPEEFVESVLAGQAL